MFKEAYELMGLEHVYKLCHPHLKSCLIVKNLREIMTAGNWQTNMRIVILL